VAFVPSVENVVLTTMHSHHPAGSAIVLIEVRLPRQSFSQLCAAARTTSATITRWSVETDGETNGSSLLVERKGAPTLVGEQQRPWNHNPNTFRHRESGRRRSGSLISDIARRAPPANKTRYAALGTHLECLSPQSAVLLALLGSPSWATCSWQWQQQRAQREGKACIILWNLQNGNESIAVAAAWAPRCDSKLQQDKRRYRLYANTACAPPHSCLKGSWSPHRGALAGRICSHIRGFRTAKHAMLYQ
jgi:hypothetical protein